MILAIPPKGPSGISIFIPTKNEENDLAGCVASVSWSDDIVVYDSHSDDSTREIAGRLGCRVVLTPGDGSVAFGGDEASHKNWALEHIKFKHPWVLHLDADERANDELVSKLLHAIESPGECSAFSIRRRDYWRGKWLRYVQASPFFVRLYKPDCIKYERLINPVMHVIGKVGRLDGHITHFPFSKGVGHWIAKHNTYSSLEAAQLLADEKSEPSRSYLSIFSRDFHERRKYQKIIFYKIPFRPVVKFFLLFFVKGGFWDGRAGFHYACLQSIYEYFIVQKVFELRKKGADN